MAISDSMNINNGSNAFEKVRGSWEKKEFNLSPLGIVEKGDVNFYRYIKKLGIPDDPDLVILSSNNHYYYGENDLQNVKTIINLKRLNMIKRLDKFLCSLINILPPDTNFLGCFSDGTGDRNELRGGKFSRIVLRFNNFLDSKTDRDMDMKKVTDLLVSHGFKIFDMSKIDGVTYFHSKLVQGIQ